MKETMNMSNSGIDDMNVSGGRAGDERLRKILSAKPEPPPPKRVVYDSETRAQMYERMKHRMWRRKMLKNVFDVAVLLGLLFSCWFIYKAWDSHLEHKRALAAAEREAAAKLEAEREKLRAEEREKLRAAQEAERAAAEAAREAVEAERKRAERERNETADAYRLFMYAFRENEFDMFGKTVTNGLEQTGGELCYLLPVGEKDYSVYWAAYPTNGAPLIAKIDERGDREPVEAETFSKRIASLDYLVARDGKVYYHARRKRPLWGVLSKTEPCDPADLFFAGLRNAIDRLKPEYADLVFDVVFIPKNSSKRIVCETLEFGCRHSIENVRDAVEKEFPPKSYGTEAFRLKKYKRTVKFWNGPMIKRGVDGITYVPRSNPSTRIGYSSFYDTPRGYTTIYRRTAYRAATSGEWSALASRVHEEDAEEASYYERQRREHEEKRRRGASAAVDAYAKRIDGILRDGELYYHARKREAEKKK